ncbi:hypothetical protein BH20ACT8_BH20ACT8_21890 [soil metagenome]
MKNRTTKIMARAAEELEWMAQIGALTAIPVQGRDGDAVAHASRTAMRLVGLARALLDRGEVPRTAGTTLDPGAADLADLVRMLADVTIPSAATPNVDPLAPAFLDTLASDGCSAVFVCRTVLHQSGACLFPTTAVTTPLCGRVLVAAHRVGGGFER